MMNSVVPGASGARGRKTMLAALALAGTAILATPGMLLGDDFAAADSTNRDSVVAAAPTSRARVSEHVVVISIDGLRPDAIGKFGAKTIQRMMSEGAFTLNAQTIQPSKTLPSHTSMLTGVDVDEHGINWNTDETDSHGHVAVPTMFALAKEHGYTTAAFFSKTKFHHLEIPNTIDYVRSPHGNGWLHNKWMATRTVSEVEKYLESGAESPNLLFVHIGEPDYAGHFYGWMTPMYGQAVLEADAAVAEILDEAEEKFGQGNFSVILTADHGGNGRSHGGKNPLDTTIPWIAWGKGVQQGAVLPSIRTMDTAATALWLLGVDAPEKWEGHPVALAYSAPENVAN